MESDENFDKIDFAVDCSERYVDNYAKEEGDDEDKV